MITSRPDTPLPAWLDGSTVVSPRPPTDHERGQIEPTLRLRVEWPTPGVVTVHIGGELDLGALPRLTEMIRQRLRAASLERVILDFSEVTYASSAAMELLMTARRAAVQREVTLAVVPGSGPVARLLKLTGVSALFSCYDEITEALRSAGR